MCISEITSRLNIICTTLHTVSSSLSYSRARGNLTTALLLSMSWFFAHDTIAHFLRLFSSFAANITLRGNNGFFHLLIGRRRRRKKNYFQVPSGCLSVLGFGIELFSLLKKRALIACKLKKIKKNQKVKKHFWIFNCEVTYVSRTIFLKNSCMMPLLFALSDLFMPRYPTSKKNWGMLASPPKKKREE